MTEEEQDQQQLMDGLIAQVTALKAENQRLRRKKRRVPKRILDAAKRMDWMQVVLNQADPCFHLEEDGSFCGRAKRWAGHEDGHKFVSLAELMEAL